LRLFQSGIERLVARGCNNESDGYAAEPENPVVMGIPRKVKSQIITDESLAMYPAEDFLDSVGEAFGIDIDQGG